ncbi:MAG: M16 family metallopeptidase [Bryobacteraceae bacterium]
MKRRIAVLALTTAGILAAQPRIVALPSDSPLITFRLVFQTGAALDPAGKEGLASLTAAMLAEGGTREMTYKQIVDAMFPMATSVGARVDKEMTAFTAATHADNLEQFYTLLRAMLLDPGWRQEDLKRLKDNAVNYLRVTLRGNNDEELGKEVLYLDLYRNHPYGWHNAGRVSSLQKITMEDVKDFYKKHYSQTNLTIGIAGGYPKNFPERLLKDFAQLPAKPFSSWSWREPDPVKGIRVTLVEKDTRGVAISMGFPIQVRRGHPDYAALLVATACFGQHRTSGGRLYSRLREARGLNYGDYAYIEYFPDGMYRLEPEPNLGRSGQIFQIWIRPVEPATAHFALRAALWEYEKLIRDGLSQEEFERWRNFVSKNVNLLMRTKSAELGYAIDSLYYGIPNYKEHIQKSLAGLTREQVNAAIRRHLQTENMQIVIVGKDCNAFRSRLLSNQPSPMKYNSPKPKAILDEDKFIERLQIRVTPGAIRLVPADDLFE